ncbi:MAG: hypothetical protein ACRCYY_10755 [Trueperaceae bacterium]
MRYIEFLKPEQEIEFDQKLEREHQRIMRKMTSNFVIFCVVATVWALTILLSFAAMFFLPLEAKSERDIAQTVFGISVSLYIGYVLGSPSRTKRITKTRSP